MLADDDLFEDELDEQEVNEVRLSLSFIPLTELLSDCSSTTLSTRTNSTSRRSAKSRILNLVRRCSSCLQNLELTSCV